MEIVDEIDQNQVAAPRQSIEIFANDGQPIVKGNSTGPSHVYVGTPDSNRVNNPFYNSNNPRRNGGISDQRTDESRIDSPPRISQQRDQPNHHDRINQSNRIADSRPSNVSVESVGQNGVLRLVPPNEVPAQLASNRYQTQNLPPALTPPTDDSAPGQTPDTLSTNDAPANDFESTENGAPVDPRYENQSTANIDGQTIIPGPNSAQPYQSNPSTPIGSNDANGLTHFPASTDPTLLPQLSETSDADRAKPLAPVTPRRRHFLVEKTRGAKFVPFRKCE